MTSQHWENLQEIFHEALALPPHERTIYLEQACDGDLSLCRVVESLIKSHEETSNFVDTPAFQAAAQMLVEGGELRAGLRDHSRFQELVQRIGL